MREKNFFDQSSTVTKMVELWMPENKRLRMGCRQKALPLLQKKQLAAFSRKSFAIHLPGHALCYLCWLFLATGQLLPIIVPRCSKVPSENTFSGKGLKSCQDIFFSMTMPAPRYPLDSNRSGRHALGGLAALFLQSEFNHRWFPLIWSHKGTSAWKLFDTNNYNKRFSVVTTAATFSSLPKVSGTYHNDACMLGGIFLEAHLSGDNTFFQNNFDRKCLGQPWTTFVVSTH